MDYMWLLFLGLVAIPVGAYLDAKVVKLHSFKQYLFICTWEAGLMFFGFFVGRLL